jgi:hypothetical protein
VQRESTHGQGKCRPLAVPASNNNCFATLSHHAAQAMRIIKLLLHVCQRPAA